MTTVISGEKSNTRMSFPKSADKINVSYPSFKYKMYMVMNRYLFTCKAEESSILAFSAASLKRCMAMLSFDTSMPCCKYTEQNIWIISLQTIKTHTNMKEDLTAKSKEYKRKSRCWLFHKCLILHLWYLILTGVVACFKQHPMMMCWGSYATVNFPEFWPWLK